MLPILAIVSIAGWGVYFAIRLRPRPSALEIARQTADAIHAHNSSALLALESNFEAAKLEITEQKLSELMAMSVPEDFPQWKQIDEGYSLNQLNGDLEMTRTYENGSHRKIPLNFVVSVEDEGPKCCVVNPLIVLGALCSDSEPLRSGHEKMLRFLETKGKQLDHIGITGYVDFTSGNFYAWSHTMSTLRRFVKLDEARKSNPHARLDENGNVVDGRESDVPK